MGAGAKRADADLFPLSPLTSFISGFAYSQCMGRLKQIKTNLSGAPRAIALITLGPLGDEIDVAPEQRHIGHRRGHENKLHI